MDHKFKKFVIGASLVMAASFCIGAVDQQELVEDSYIVKPGDTLWSISEEFLKKNTGGRRYILEFKSGIRELNPWLADRASECELYPGDVVRINYWVKK